jgi:hypothetical protein
MIVYLVAEFHVHLQIMEIITSLLNCVELHFLLDVSQVTVH